MNEPIITAAEKYVKDELEGLCSAHDFYHIERVLRVARMIHSTEKRGDILVIELGALLHESFDAKFYDSDEMARKETALQSIFREHGMDEERIGKTFFVIKNVGFGKSLERTADFPMIPELEIVEDADRLDAIGAIAIARTFSYGGKHHRPIYDPTQPIAEINDRASYMKGNSSSLHHFHEKLLRLIDLLHTESAKKIARPRHEFMERFVSEFMREWNSEVGMEN